MNKCTGEGEIPTLDSGQIRNEIFKLHYLRGGHGEFILNSKADSFEVLDFLLTAMHTWIQVCSGKELPAIDQSQDNGSQVAMMSSVSCLDSDCFIHSAYHLKKSQYRECVCGKRSEVFEFDNNLFAESVNMPELLLDIRQLSTERMESGKKKPKKRKQPQSLADQCQASIGLFF